MFQNIVFVQLGRGRGWEEYSCMEKNYSKPDVKTVKNVLDLRYKSAYMQNKQEKTLIVISVNV